MTAQSKLRRALSFSRDEWRTRGSQLAFQGTSWLRAQAGLSVFGSDSHVRALGIPENQLADWWMSKSRRWFVDDESCARVRRHYEEHPQARERILNHANHVLAGRMPIFSHPPVDFTATDRWTRDHILGVRAPNKFYGSIDYLNVDEVGDSKFVWEPNRFMWAYWLGQAYVVTGNEDYAHKFCELTLDWVQKNRYPVGINFCSALEMALRSYALVWALHLFPKQITRDAAVLNGILETIWTSCRHVEKNLSLYFAPNTHLIGEGFALFVCGAVFPEFQDASRWRSRGESILAAQVARQIHADGTHRELSSCYQLYTTDYYVQATLIAKRLNLRVHPAIEDAARRLAQRLAELATRDERLPQFNDCDGGRLTGFCIDPLDASPTLEAARSLGAELQTATPGCDERGYALWMAPTRAPAAAAVSGNTAPDPGGERPSSEIDSGIATYSNSSGDYVLFRSGPFGYVDCDYAHSHDAPTAFQLHLGGQPLVVDSGTGAYTQGLGTRNRFRSAEGKNVLLVERRGPSTPAGWFAWEHATHARLTHAQRVPGGFHCAGGYTAKASGARVEITRSIALFDAGVVAIQTRWNAAVPVSCELALTLAPDLEIADQKGHIVGAAGMTYGYASCVVETVQQDAEDANDPDIPKTGVREVPYSPDYGQIGRARALVLSVDSRRSGALIVVLSRSGALALRRHAQTLEITYGGGTFSMGLDEVGAPVRGGQSVGPV